MMGAFRIQIYGVLLGVVFWMSCAQIIDQKNPKGADLRHEFQKTMQGVSLQGHFTLTGQEGVYPEYYEIDEVSNISGDNYWLIHARIKYGDHDVRVPVPVRILWVDDTPVVTLTDVMIPGMGTFTARVLFYGGQYVGVWSSGEKSGQQFGRIVKRQLD